MVLLDRLDFLIVWYLERILIRRVLKLHVLWDRFGIFEGVHRLFGYASALLVSRVFLLYIVSCRIVRFVDSLGVFDSCRSPLSRFSYLQDLWIWFW